MSSFEYTFIRSFSYGNTDHSNIYSNYDKIKDHIKKLIQQEKQTNNENNENERIYVNIMLIKMVSEIIVYGQSPYTHFSNEYILEKLNSITLDDIIDKGIQWLNRYKLCRCGFFFCYNRLSPDINNEILHNIIKKYICEYGIVPTCKNMLLCYQFYIQEKRVGTIEEISEYEMLLNEIEEDPEEFHNKYKLKIPTQNLDKLTPQTMSDDFFKQKQPCCGLCQSDIEPSQTYYELPCGHMYHKSDEECLECATIIYWLKDNKVCPMCKQEVIL